MDDATVVSAGRWKARPTWERGRVRAGASGAPVGSIPALLALYVCWGSSVPAMKVMVGSIPPLAGAGMVFLLGGIVLLALARPRPRELDRREVRRAALVGALLLVGGQGLATVVLTQLTASLTAIIVATIPLMIALLGALSGRRIPLASAAWLVTGFAGVAIVLATAPAAALGASAAGVALCVVTVVFWAAGSLVSSRGGMPADVRLSGGIQLLVGGVVLLAMAAAAGQLRPEAWAHVTSSSLAAAGFLLALDSVAGFALYAHLLRTAPLELVSTYAYATPVLSAVLGFVALGEPVWTGAIVGGAVVLTAVAAQMRRP